MWARPSAIFKNRPYSIFKDKIDPQDINQGMLGNCYYLSAISSIAEHSDRIKKLFLSRNVNDFGVYCVALCLNGMWEEVIIDDQFPVQPYSLRPAFNSTKNDDIWVMLLEKAWAKVYGGYLNIDGGLAREALHDLTGAPCKSFFTSEVTHDEHWARLIRAERKNYILTASSDDFNKTGNDNRDTSTGLSPSHAYALLAVYEIEVNSQGLYQRARSSSSSNERLVKLRNPWGKGEWILDWADSDKRWNAHLKKQLGVVNEDDGVFCMPFKAFMNYFYDYQICYFFDNYIYSAQKYQTSSNSPIYLTFKISEPGKHYFSLNQINKRSFSQEDSKLFPNLKLTIRLLLLKCLINRGQNQIQWYDGSYRLH